MSRLTNPEFCLPIESFVNQVICGDSTIELKKLPDNCIDLTVTSPPYDDLRDYDNYTFDFETIAKELLRVTKDGGVLVWVVGDATINGDETATSFKQTLFFKQIGFKLHDTMIYQKEGFTAKPDSTRYWPAFEYMFVFSKGKPTTINFIKDRKNKWGNHRKSGYVREQNNEVTRRKEANINVFGKRQNIWSYKTGFNLSTKDEMAFEHPAIFPEPLAKDHILSWSNEGDLILDPLAGSGTTLKMARLLRRNYVGIEISPKYCEIINKRLAKYDNESIEVFCN